MYMPIRSGRPTFIEGLERRLLFSSYELVKDIWPLRASDPHGWTVVGDRIYFAATDNASTRVWVSDGTDAGTSEVAGSDSGVLWEYGGPIVAGGKVYFQGLVGSTPTLWVTSGLPGGTTQLSIRSGGANNNTLNNTWGAALGNRAILLGDSASTGIEVYSTDGTDSGTFVLTESLGGVHAAADAVLGANGGLVYFMDRTTEGLYRLGATDGTVAGTRILADLNTGAGLMRLKNFTSVGGIVYFQTPTSQGLRLWRSDGTVAGTGPLDTPLTVVEGSMAELGGRLYFLGSTGNGIAQLYRTDGSRNGTEQVAQIDYPSPSTAIGNLYRAGDHIWFDNWDSTRPDGLGGLWRSDGTAAGTAQFDRFHPVAPLYNDGRRLWLGTGLDRVVDLGDPSEPRATGLGQPIGNFQIPNRPFSLAVLGSYAYFSHNGDPYRVALPTSYQANVTVRTFDDADSDGNWGASELAYASKTLTAWVDLNNDGLRGGTEPTAGLRADGTALLIGVPAGQWPVRVSDTGARYTTSQAVSVTVTSGANPPPVTFGLNRNNRVHGSIYNDLDADGQRDLGEPGLADRRVWLDMDGDGVFDLGEPAALTAPDGTFYFERLNANGVLRAELPDSWRSTQSGAGIAYSFNATATDRTVSPFGQTSLPVPGTVRGSAYLDFDTDGVRNAVEPQAMVAVTVFLDADDDGLLDAGERSLVTASGSFAFDQVSPGMYRLGVVPPTGWVVSGTPPQFSLAAGGSATASAGLAPLRAAAPVSGTVFNDDDFDGSQQAGEPGVAGALVFLDLNANDGQDSGEPLTTTDYDGQYRFPGLAAGTYRVVARTMSAYQPVAPKNPQARVVSYDGIAPAAPADFAVALLNRAARITGRVYVDNNGSNTFDSGDTAVPNVLVRSAGQAEIRSVLTDADGVYDLPTSATQLTVSLALPPGWTAASASSVVIIAPPSQLSAGPDFRLNATAPLPSAIVGVAFHDADGDGVRDPFEPALQRTFEDATAVPYLDLDHDALRDPAEPYALLDDRGAFFFGSLPAGTYDLRLGSTGGFTTTTPGSGLHIVTLGVAERSTLHTFGAAVTPGTFSGEIYLDANLSKARDPSDPPAPGVKVALDLNGDGLFGNLGDVVVTTNTSGAFVFHNVSPGTYNASLLLNANQEQVEPAAGVPLRISVAAGQATTGAVFGIARARGLVGGSVYFDSNANGQLDATDQLFAGWTVHVVDLADATRTWDRTTGQNGRWSVDDLVAGTYRVTISPASSVFDTSSPASGEYIVTLAKGAVRDDLNFGFVNKPVTLVGDVFDDANGDGAWTAGEGGRAGVNVYVDANKNGQFDAGEVSTVTDASGHFSVPPFVSTSSSVSVRAVRPARSLQTAPYGDDPVLTAIPVPGQVTNMGQIGFRTPTSHVISGIVFLDQNGNGQRDAGEPPIVGRTVVMDVNVDGQASIGDQFVKTDAEGWYAFTRFDPRADYRVRQVLPTDWVGTLPANGGWRILPFSPNEIYSDVDFGSLPWSATGEVFSDLDGDGMRDASEGGASGQNVFIDLNDNGALDLGEPAAVTDAAGQFSLFVAAPGTYRVRLAASIGWVQTFPSNGAAYSEALTLGTTVHDRNFGVASVPVSPPSPTALTYASPADAHVRDGAYAAQNFGTAGVLEVRKSSFAGNQREAYIRFDLSQVPSADLISSAKVRLYGKLSAAAGSVPVGLYTVASGGWTEAGIKWSSKPAAAASPLRSVTVSSTVGTWFELDVTNYLKQQKQAGAASVNFALKATAFTTPWAMFNSDEAADHHPELSVRVGTPPPATQAIVLSSSNAIVPEGKTAAVTVKLAAQPTANVVVSVARTAGDADLSAAVSTLTFTPANWDVAQSLTVAAAPDSDATNGSATFTFSATGISAKTLIATEADDDVARTLRPSADSYVRDGSYAGTNYGAATSLFVRKSTTAGATRWTVLKFDLSQITTVSSAILRLYGKVESTAAASVRVQAFTASSSSWTSAGVTWQNKPTPSGSNLAEATVSGTTAKWYQLDLTAWLKAQKAAGKTTAALVLTSPTATAAAVVLNSGENGSNKPELVVKG